MLLVGHLHMHASSLAGRCLAGRQEGLDLTFQTALLCDYPQGSAFERDLRRFHKHAAAPPALTARVGPADVPPLAGEAEQFAAYVDSTQVEEKRRAPHRAGGRQWRELVCASGGTCARSLLHACAPSPVSTQSLAPRAHAPSYLSLPYTPVQELSLLAPGEAVEVHVAGGGGSVLVPLCPVAREGAAPLRRWRASRRQLCGSAACHGPPGVSSGVQGATLL